MLLVSFDVENILELIFLLKSNTAGVFGCIFDWLGVISECVSEEELGLVGEGLFVIIPLAAHLDSNLFFDFDPGGRPTVKTQISIRYLKIDY